MKQVLVSEVIQNIKQYGRTLYHQPSGQLFFNWTCSGIGFEFTGTTLIAEFTADAGIEYEGIPGDTTAPTHLNWPVVGIFIDDSSEPSYVYIINEKEKRQLIFSSDLVETHQISIRKLTENLKTDISIKGFYLDGEIKPPVDIKKKRIEFVGDSITCGFGNMTKERDRLFFSEDENGWYSHAAIASRMLNAEVSVLSVSGICATTNKGLPNPYAMDELYAYQDKITQDKLKGATEKHDFAAVKNDIVVINLGTNDGTGILFSTDKEEINHFRSGYRAFIEQVRSCNGADTHIICALGSMDYYLYDEIEKIVEAYKKDSGDEKIRCFKYTKIHPLDGFGACGHPSLITQQKMAMEIADEIQRILK